MITETDISKKELKAFLKEMYNIEVLDLEFLPLGEAGYCYKVKGVDHNLYFLKLIKPLYLEEREEIQTILFRLKNELKIQNLISPIKAKNGKFILSFGDYYLLLQPFIKAHHPVSSDYSYSEISQSASALAQIHTSLNKLGKIDISKEAFELYFEDEYLRCMSDLENLTFDVNSYKARLQKLIIEWKPELERRLSKLKVYQKKVMEIKDYNWVLSHQDLHTGNILIDNNGILYIIDWDEMKVTPQEQDFVFFIGKFKEFLEVYRKYNPKVKLHLDLFPFYWLRRFFQDLTDWMQRILYTNSDDEQNKSDLDGIINDCFATYNHIDKDKKKLETKLGELKKLN